MKTALRILLATGVAALLAACAVDTAGAYCTVGPDGVPVCTRPVETGVLGTSVD